MFTGTFHEALKKDEEEFLRQNCQAFFELASYHFR